MNKAPVITIDGPSATGKGTIASRVARRLGYRLLDSGALYRVLALAAHERGVDLDDGTAIAALAPRLDIAFPANGKATLAGRDVSTEIRTGGNDERASRVAALPEVRQILLPVQHGFRKPPGLVAEGRDMGEVVFPDARCKFFLTASAEIRARRRHKQLIGKGLDARLPGLLRDLRSRDRRDEQRSISPSRPASGAVEIDTSELTIDQVVDRVMGVITAN
ncbi:MAG: (d)CMP kinase [Gammaproteobacteria bacterium]|nr:(d)CMP kinase [Gammaproteobacteria bacterium]MCY4181333.1 (d)CMP kinase [Gammaproteobacteria bacterium]MCY4268932.1 (d)CMP kinase [Gammaproteobacteria bacterium]